MIAAVREAVEELDAVTGIVYLVEDDGKALSAAVIGGSPPSIFTMPERLTPDVPYASLAAWRTGTVVVGEPTVRPEDEPLAGLVPFPFSVASAPVVTGGHRFGALTLIRSPSVEFALDEDQLERLREIGTRLALGLAPLAERGIPIAPGPKPLLFPVFAGGPRPPPRSSAWGWPDVPGSAGLTFMYQVHKLTAALNEAMDTDDVVMAAQSRIMIPFGAEALVLNTVNDGRLWVVGHSGAFPETVRRLHGSSAESGTPAADALYGHDPMFFRNRADMLAAYPDAPDDGRQAWAFLPLRAGGRWLGVCCVGFAEAHTFDAQEQAVMMMMANLLGPALERARLSESEHKLAESLQKRLLPSMLSELPGLVTTARYLPARAKAGVGGDWYDTIALPGGRIGLVVGDVEGHSIESSIIMGQLRSALIAYAAEGHDPAAVLTQTGELLAKLDTELLATCCFVRLDVTDGVAEVALAGHPAPLVRRPGGHVDALEGAPGVPLGVHTAEPYRAFETTLPPGSLLLLYTDGLAGSRPHDTAASAQALLASDDEDAGHNLEALADRLLATVSAPSDRRDDVVLLLVRYEGARLGPHRRINRMEIQRHDMQGVKTARRFIRNSLRSWGLDALADDLELIASEVVTNALIHAGSEVDLRLREYPDHIRLEVRDSDTTPPVPSSISMSEEERPQAEHGRGLVIVEGLASVWGSSPSGRGKTVWLELPT
jgi:serine phosphatase RsbU (regulator of sigma subunit)/anti-sigma regulatory factor (Ser/Thr protein kinase)